MQRVAEDRRSDNAGQTWALKVLRWVIPAALALLLTAHASTPGGESATIMRFERSIYFTDPDGRQVLAQPGLYAVTVTAGGSRLRLYPAGGAAPLTLATEITRHEEVETPLPLALILSKEDEVHVALLLPERKALDARGSYSGARPQPPGPSPEWLSQGYHDAASERLKRAGRRQAKWNPPPGRPIPSWTGLEVTTDLGAKIYTSQLVDKTWSAYRASPGANISVSGLAIAGVESVDAVRLVVYTGFYKDSQISRQDEFGTVRVPLKLDRRSISPDRRSFSAVLDATVSGLPPGPAYLEVDYQWAGASRTIALGSVARPDSPSATWLRYRLPPLYFVPEYAVYSGDVQIHIAENGLGENVDSIVDPLGDGLVYPPYWLLQRVSLQPLSDFVGGKPFLRAPCASARVPRQGYRTKMDPPASGTATMNYRLVGPRGMQPPGVQTFDSFSELESYSGAIEETLPALPVNPKYVDWLASMGLVGLCQGRRR
ncbi:MAG: hypothetical protein JRD94_10695 [Deltaproteobacteria bacterium]|nr:hypothetical protein [Deltaproteobacteria bacterium]